MAFLNVSPLRCTPMQWACKRHQETGNILLACQWLSLAGTLRGADGHICALLAASEVFPSPRARVDLFQWATGRFATSTTFVAVVLPSTTRGARAGNAPHGLEHLALGGASGIGLRRLVADFVGVPTGRLLRSYRELVQVLSPSHTADFDSF